MIGIDTNVLVRLLIEDDEEQTRRARRLVDQAEARGDAVLVSSPVVLEAEWVLRSRYGLGRDEVLTLFHAALSVPTLWFEGEAALEEALHEWADSACGLADCLIAAHNRRMGCRFTATFDTKAAKLTAMRLV